MSESDVVIIGGGLTGLSLAHRLQAAGHDYTVLEARDRFGGRILSESTASGGAELRYDLGPSWFWPGQPRIARLVQQFRLTVFEQYSQGRLVYQDAEGRVRRDYDFSTMAGSLRLEGGVARLIEAFRAELDDIRCKSGYVVARIERQGSGFEVSGASAQGRFVVRARQNVVVALPPRVAAATIDFEPVLPADTVTALRSIPTWMAGHAKVVAVYARPFWRDQGLSGDGISQFGPLMEVHDASPHSQWSSAQTGALFGFVGLPPGAPQRAPSVLVDLAVRQLEAMFGPDAGQPLDVLLKDWSRDERTATTEDDLSGEHPAYGMPSAVDRMAADGILFASTELGSQFGGFLEGALEVSEQTWRRLASSDSAGKF